MKIIEYAETEQYMTLFIDNVRNKEMLIKIVNLIRKICNLKDNNLIDIKEYKNKIQSYLNSLENFVVLAEYKSSKIPENIISAIGQFRKQDDLINILPLMADYFLETTIIPSELNCFDTLSKNKEQIMEGPGYYIENGFSDIVFAFFDSDDFLVCFNKRKYDKQEIIDTIINELTQ